LRSSCRLPLISAPDVAEAAAGFTQAFDELRSSTRSGTAGRANLF
jgi:hypothetical protein